MSRLSKLFNATGVAVISIATTVAFSSCATYYQKIATFNHNFERKDYAAAKSYLENNKKLASKKNTAVLYDLNLATVAHLTGDYNQSIQLFNKADNYYQSHTKNIGLEAVALLANPNVTPYKLENFEPVMLHFFQALNYIAVDNYEEAIVECRRMNEVLNALSDKFKILNNAKHYSQDAFGHYLMGILYETVGDANNAFIAYRNALNIYQGDYSAMYKIPTPTELKYSLVRAARATGFTTEANQYEKELEISAQLPPESSGRMVAFILDGFAPVKDQVDLTFTRIGNSDGLFSFQTEYDGANLLIPYIPDKDGDDDPVNIIHMSLPKYVSRRSECDAERPVVLVDKEMQMAAVAEDIEAIARQSLHDRIWAEVGKSLLRVIAKQAASKAVTNKNDILGAIFEIGSAIAERADTRHWQSLPGRIMVVDRYLSPGSHTIEYTSCGYKSTATVEVRAGKTSFVVIPNY